MRKISIDLINAMIYSVLICRNFVQSLTESESSSEEDEEEMSVSAVAPGLDDSLIKIETGTWLAPSSYI